MSKTFSITTAIHYANGAPHIGHAYEMIATDMIARFKRLDGYDVHFLTGMDEHGQKIAQTAAKQGLAPRALVDDICVKFKDMHTQLGISFDTFIRTTDAKHQAGAKLFWNKMVEAGDIYLARYSGWYSVRDEAYYDESEVTTNADGKKLAPTGTPVEWMEEESYFFKLSKYEERLLKLYEDHPDFIQPAFRRNEILNFVKSGLKDLCVSRTTFDWGIPVPNAPGHVMYVWVDALANYITALDYEHNGAHFKKYWPNDVHIIGKDINRFHTVYWPAFLMSANIPLPKAVFAHGWLLSQGEKMSKSAGNVVTPESLASTYGIDQLRYFLLKEIPFGNDGNISHDVIVAQTNAGLANDFGNLAQRSLSMIAKNCGGVVPKAGTLTAEDTAILDAAKKALGTMRAAMEKYELHHAVQALWHVVAEANKYFADSAPWGLKNSNPERMATILYVTADVVRRLAILAQPVVPFGMGKMLDQLAVPENKRSFADLENSLVPGTPLPVPQGVFPRYQETPENAG